MKLSLRLSSGTKLETQVYRNIDDSSTLRTIIDSPINNFPFRNASIGTAERNTDDMAQ